MVNYTTTKCTASHHYQRGTAGKDFYFKDDLFLNDVLKKVSRRKRYDAFFEKFKFERYKTQHCNQSKEIIKKATYVDKAGKVNDTELLKEGTKSNKAKKRLSVHCTKND